MSPTWIEFLVRSDYCLKKEKYLHKQYYDYLFKFINKIPTDGTLINNLLLCMKNIHLFFPQTLANGNKKLCKFKNLNCNFFVFLICLFSIFLYVLRGQFEFWYTLILLIEIVKYFIYSHKFYIRLKHFWEEYHLAIIMRSEEEVGYEYMVSK